jgi:hypothetical protein
MSRDRAEAEENARRALAEPTAPLPSGRLFVTPQEVAAAFGMDERSIRRAIAAGQIPATKVGVFNQIPASWLRERAGLGDDDDAA